MKRIKKAANVLEQTIKKTAKKAVCVLEQTMKMQSIVNWTSFPNPCIFPTTPITQFLETITQCLFKLLFITFFVIVGKCAKIIPRL